MRAFLFFCFVLFASLCVTFTISEHPSFAQEMDEPVVTYSEPQITSGDPARCKMLTVADNYQMTIQFIEAIASSQDSKQDSLKCRVEMDATIQLKKGWYFDSVEHNVGGGITQAPQSTAVLAISSTFKKKPVLRIREKSVFRGVKNITRSNSIPVNFAWSKAKQCSGAIENATGKIVLNLAAQTKNAAQAKLDSFDVALIYARCDS
jgi:hypothetical protein